MLAIGQKRSTVLQLITTLTEERALDYSIYCCCNCCRCRLLCSLLHHMQVVLWENIFRDNGRHAVIIYDDLSKQAVAYRQMSFIVA